MLRHQFPKSHRRRVPMINIINLRYILYEKLGEGGMGAVYRATDRLNGQTVALKRVVAPTQNLMFNSKASNTTNFRVALAREFQTLASLRHPHIISVLDYGFDAENQPFFTMEFLDSAKTIVEASREKSEEDRISLIEQLSQAIL